MTLRGALTVVLCLFPFAASPAIYTYVDDSGSTGLFAFHVAWNEYLYASILLWSSELQTLSAGVATFMGKLAPSSWGLLMAAGVMITLPVIILFSFMQSYLIAGWGGGGVKG